VLVDFVDEKASGFQKGLQISIDLEPREKSAIDDKALIFKWWAVQDSKPATPCL
jgi:hypothetical protein